MTIRWPDTLPGASFPAFALEPVDASRRTDMETGAKKTRRITFARLDKVKMEWRMKDTEFVAFRSWDEGTPVSLAGASDDMAAWGLSNLTRSAGVATGPDFFAVDRLLETVVNSTHYAAMTLSGAASDGVPVLCRATLKAAGRTKARLILIDRSGGSHYVDADLTTGVLSGATGLISSSISDRGNGWWRVTLIATSSTGPSDPIMRTATLDATGTLSYTGDITKGIDICEVQARISTGYDLFVPSDADGNAMGSNAGSAWFWTYLAFGGGVQWVEARFTGRYSAPAQPGLIRIVSAELEVRNA